MFNLANQQAPKVNKDECKEQVALKSTRKKKPKSQESANISE
jgi:hypothetical protein